VGTTPVVSDAAAALTALQHDPGLPTRGVVAVCDVGGTGASITLADAGAGYQPIGASLRHPDLSGDLIDQALLTHLVTDLTAAAVNGLNQSAGPFMGSVPVPPPGGSPAWGANYTYTPNAGAGTFTVAATGDGTTITMP